MAVLLTSQTHKRRAPQFGSRGLTIQRPHVCTHPAWRPVLDEGARTCPDPWPNPDVVIVNPNTCLESASQLEGEQTIFLPCTGSEQYASPCILQNFPSLISPFPSPLDTLARENPPGEGTATERHTTEDCRPEPWKPPDMHAEDLQEAGGVPSVSANSPAFPENVDHFGHAGVAENTDAGEVEPPGIDVHE